MTLAVALGAFGALLVGDLRAMLFTVPIAVVAVSVCCILHLALFTKR